jgi:protease I
LKGYLPPMLSKKILILISAAEFDPSETAIPWKILKEEGHEVFFATLGGEKPYADPIMVTGKGLLFFKYFLKANGNAEKTYYEMTTDPKFSSPLKVEELDPKIFDALIIPGGHSKKMRPFLESCLVHEFVAAFSKTNKPIAAICHGVLLMARAKDSSTKKSLLHGRKTTALPAYMEKSGFFLTCLWLGKYYLTYDISEEDEVRAALENKDDWIRGPLSFSRDSKNNLKPGFVVKDGNYLSARWPGDVHKFTYTLIEMLKKS